VSGLGGEELGAQVTRLAVDVAALAWLAKFELRVGGEQALVISWSAEGFFAASLLREASSLVSGNVDQKGATGVHSYRVKCRSMGCSHCCCLNSQCAVEKRNWR